MCQYISRCKDKGGAIIRKGAVFGRNAVCAFHTECPLKLTHCVGESSINGQTPNTPIYY